jgi:hypothetical protein
MLLLLPRSCFRSPPSDAYCWNPWIFGTVDKTLHLYITSLSLTLALTRSLKTLSYSDHTSLDTKRSKGALSCHGPSRKHRASHILILREILVFMHCTGFLEYNNFHIRCTNTSRNIRFWFIQGTNTPENERTFIFGPLILPKIRQKF